MSRHLCTRPFWIKDVGPSVCILCRYSGLDLSDELMQHNAAGQVDSKLETPWRDGTTHL